MSKGDKCLGTAPTSDGERVSGRGKRGDKKDEAAATRHDERRLCPLLQGAGVAFHFQNVIFTQGSLSNYQIERDFFRFSH